MAMLIKAPAPAKSCKALMMNKSTMLQNENIQDKKWQLLLKFSVSHDNAWTVFLTRAEFRLI